MREKDNKIESRTRRKICRERNRVTDRQIDIVIIKES